MTTVNVEYGGNVVQLQVGENTQAALNAATAATTQADRAEDAADDAATSAAAVGNSFTARPGASFGLDTASGLVAGIVNESGLILPERLAPFSADPVLADLISCPACRWAGQYDPARGYAVGDILVHGAAFYFVWQGRAGEGAGDPADEPWHFEPLPLYPKRAPVMDLDFTALPASAFTAINHPWSAGLSVTGDGAASAAVDADGYLSAAGNTYFMFLNIPGAIKTEFRSDTLFPVMSGNVTTMSMSATGLPGFATGGNADMFHLNNSTNTTGVLAVWDNTPGPVAGPFVRWRWRNSAKLEAAVANVQLWRARGNVLLGYLHGELCHIVIDDFVGEKVAAANAFYIQNHVATFGAIRHLRASVEIAVGV